jgi:copper oxidase (laccase) domain-containing protein
MTLRPILADSLHEITHGFFTRQGGVSTGIYAALNGGQGSNDTAGAVDENRARIAAHLGVGRLVSVHQVHSARAEVVNGPWNGAKPQADAMVTLTADCAPVLFADRDAGVVGAAHAGWKGALFGVLEATVSAMVGLGADRGRIAAAVGPTISQRAYEVGPEYVERFLDEEPELSDRNMSSGFSTRNRNLGAFLLMARATGRCLTYPGSALTSCARQASAVPNGSATAPIPTRRGSSAIAVPAMRANLITAVLSPPSPSDRIF